MSQRSLDIGTGGLVSCLHKRPGKTLILSGNPSSRGAIKVAGKDSGIYSRGEIKQPAARVGG